MSPFQKAEFERMLNQWKDGQLSIEDCIERVDAYIEVSNSGKLPVSGRSEQLPQLVNPGDDTLAKASAKAIAKFL